MTPTIQLAVAPIDPLCAAAHHAEGRIHGRDRRTADDEEGSKRARTSSPPSVTMKGGHVEKGHDEPLEAPMAVPSAMPTASAMIHVAGWSKPISGGRIFMRDCHDHADEAEDRTDGQVDVAGDDDQHHACRHDRYGRCLNRQVPEIARGQEEPTEKARLSKSESRAR